MKVMWMNTTNMSFTVNYLLTPNKAGRYLRVFFEAELKIMGPA